MGTRPDCARAYEPNEFDKSGKLAAITLAKPKDRKRVTDQMFEEAKSRKDNRQQLMLIADAVLKCRRIGRGKYRASERRELVRLQIIKAIRKSSKLDQVESGWNWLHAIINRRLNKTQEAPKKKTFLLAAKRRRKGTKGPRTKIRTVAERHQQIRNPPGSKNEKTPYSCCSVLKSRKAKEAIDFALGNKTFSSTERKILKSMVDLAKNDHGLSRQEQDLRIALEADINPREVARRRGKIAAKFACTLNTK